MNPRKGVKSRLDCVFRIVEHTNYHLSSILTDNGYVVKECGVIGEWNITEDAGNTYVPRETQCSLFLKNGAERENAESVMTGADTVIGIKQQELLFLPDGNLPDVGIEIILRFSVDNGVTRILADIPEKEELPDQYGRQASNEPICTVVIKRSFLYNSSIGNSEKGG